MKQRGQTISCDEFISQIIAKVADTINKRGAERVRETNSRGQGNRPWVDYKPDAISGLDLLDKISTFTLVEDLKVAGHGAGGTTTGSIRGGDPQVLLQQKGYYVPIDRGSNPVKMWTNWYVRSAIHEMTHLAGPGFSDGALAQAAFDLGFSKIKVANPGTSDVTEIFQNSGTWEQSLTKYCGAR